MGFDNESIINIQSLPGEYFCPVCRQLVYPNEAIQTQCTHLYCKPCLTYVLSTTRACPYDGYLVTDTDSKALQEANPVLADTIGRVPVHCLYHKSGCTWQGPLSESIAHGNGCQYGSSPVVCNRCGTQIVHRQVQEHAQNCPGTQGQVPQQESAPQAQSAAVASAHPEQTQVVQATGQQYAAQTTAQVTQAPVSQPTPYGMSQDQNQGMAVPQTATQASATEQWYQQQYQQYYQQYPQYDQYQQQYQQYDQYQQQVQAQLQQQVQPQGQVPGQVQAQAQAQLQGQVQAQVQPQGQPQPQTQHHHQAHPHPHPHPHPQPQAQPQPQPQPQPQVQVHPQPQPQPQMQVQAQAQAQAQAHAHPQLQPQAQAVHASQPYQQGQGHAGLMPQQLQPQHQLMQPQLHQLMPNQSQQIPMQQHPMPVQSQLQPAQQTQQHALNLHQQFQSPQQPQLQQQLPPSQQAAHIQQQPALLNQQLPQQQPQLQQHAQLHQQHQQIVHQPPPQQQLMLQQQIPPQVQQSPHGPLQQSPHGPVQQHQQFPSQHHQLPQQQQQAPFFPQPIQAQQPHMQPPFQQATAQPSQMQPAVQSFPQPVQSFPQAFPQSAGHTNVPQQVGSRPLSTQNQGVQQQPFPQSQGRLHPSAYGQTVRGPTKALQATPNQVAMPNQGVPPSQAFMPRHGQRSQVPHQRPLVHQSALPRPSSQQSVSGSATTQSMRTGAQTSTTSGAPKLAPALEKPQEINAQDKITKVSQNEHGLQPAKSVQLDEVNDAPGKKNVVETVKAENMMSDKKPEHIEQQLAIEKAEQKNLSILEPAKSEASDSSQQQMSTKDLQFEKLEPNLQQSVSQKKGYEDLPEKIPEVSADKNSQEPIVHTRDAISEHARHRQDGNMQQYPRQSQETNFLKNVTQKVQEPRRPDDKRQSTRSSQDNLKWQEGNVLQQLPQGQERSLQPPLRQGLIQGQEKNIIQSSRQGPVQAQDKNLQHTSRQGSIQGQDKSLPPPPRQGLAHGQDRNLMQPSRQGQNRSFQQPLRQGSVSGQDRSSHTALQQGPVQGQERSLQQPLQNERDMQQISMQAQAQGQERFQPPRQGQLQGAQLPYSGQPQNADRNFPQLPYQGQPHNISDQFHLSSSKQSGMPSMSMLPQNQPNNMSPFARGHGQVQVPPKHFDMPSPSHLHHQQMVPPRSSQGESMLALPLSLSSSMSHHLSSFEGPRGFMDRSLQYGQTLEQSSLSKPMDHMDILGNRRSEVFENKQNDPQQLVGSRFSMTQPSGQQTNIMKPNGASTKGHIEGMQAPAFPPIMGEEGSFRSMQHDSGRQFPDRKEFQDNSRKYKPGQFDGQIPSNPDEMFPQIRHQKGQPAPISKFDQIAPTSRPLEGGPHGFLPDSISKYPFTSAGSPSGGPSRLFPPYQSIGSFPTSTGGPSMFNSDSGDGPRFPGIHEEMMGRRPESGGMRPDFMGPRSEFGRNRLDPLAPPRSPGKDYMGMPSGRPNIGPSGGFGPVGGPPHLSRPIEDVNRDPLGFDEQRNKPFGFHSGAMHNVFPSGQLPPGVGNRFPPFHSGPAPGAPGGLPNPMMMGDPVANFGVNIPMQGFPGEGGFFKKQGQMPNDAEPLDLGRKRKPGSTGWCRICQIDCYTVEGLEQHTQTREHQKRAMDMVLSIKQDSAKRQKISTEDPMSQENGNKTKKASFESRGSRR